MQKFALKAKVTLRSRKPEDTPVLYNLIYGTKNPEWKNTTLLISRSSRFPTKYLKPSGTPTSKPINFRVICSSKQGKDDWHRHVLLGA